LVLYFFLFSFLFCSLLPLLFHSRLNYFYYYTVDNTKLHTGQG
jgi:hypothetical protein